MSMYTDPNGLDRLLDQIRDRWSLERSYDGPGNIEYRFGIPYIKGPGKFEGEPLWVEWFYYCSEWATFEVDLSDSSDKDDEAWDDEGRSGPILYVFEVDAEIRLVWPELPANQSYIAFYERDDGFVCSIDDDQISYLVAGDFDSE